MPFLPYQSRNPVVTSAAWLPFFLGMPPFSLVSSLCCLKYTPGFLLQLFPNILLYPTLCLVVPCCFLFIVALPRFMFSLIREALCCWYLFTCPWSGQVIWWQPGQTGFSDLSPHESCVSWVRSGEGEQCFSRESSWALSTNQSEGLAPFYFLGAKLSFVFPTFWRPHL